MSVLLDTKKFEETYAKFSNVMEELDGIVEATGKPLSDEQQATYENAKKECEDAKKIIEHFRERNKRITGNGNEGEGGGTVNQGGQNFGGQNSGAGNTAGHQGGTSGGNAGRNQPVSREVNGLILFGNEQVPGEGNRNRTRVKDPDFVNSPSIGFRNQEEFVTAVMDFSKKRQEGYSWRNATDDDRIKYLATERQIEFMNAAGENGDIGVSADQTGSVFVPEEYSPEMFKTNVDLPSSAFRTSRRRSASRVIHKRYRLDKDHRRSVTGGFSVGRQYELCVNRSSSAKYAKYTVNLHAIYGAYVASDDLLQFNPAMIAQEVKEGFETEFESERVIEILNGLGDNAQYHGIWHSDAVIKVPPKSGASGGDFSIGNSTTIVKEDVYRINERMWRGNNRSALVWLAGLKMMTPLKMLQDTNQDGSNHFLYEHGGGPAWADGVLDGIPIVFTEYLPPMGYLGCLGLYNMAEFEEYSWKPMRMASSMHAKFMTNEQVFKFWTYTGGRPRWDSTLIPKAIADDADDALINANTLSPFVLWDGDSGHAPKASKVNRKKAA